MDIAAPANCRSVSEMFGHFLHSADNGSFALRLAVKRLEFTQGLCGELRPSPGPEILGSDLFSGDLAQIVIHLCGPDGMALALIVHILEELIAWQIARVLHNAGETPVVDVSLVVLTAFAAKADVNTAAFDGDMPVAQGRQSEALVRLRVLAVANTKERQLHQADNGCKDSLTLQARPFEILLHSCSKLRQHLGEDQELVVFRFD